MSFYFHQSFALLVSLSDRHLKRIERLSEGISPLTLLLSSNEISRVENLQYFAHLQQVRTAVATGILMIKLFAHLSFLLRRHCMTLDYYTHSDRHFELKKNILSLMTCATFLCEFFSWFWLL